MTYLENLNEWFISVLTERNLKCFEMNQNTYDFLIQNFNVVSEEESHSLDLLAPKLSAVPIYINNDLKDFQIETKEDEKHVYNCS